MCHATIFYFSSHIKQRIINDSILVYKMKVREHLSKLTPTSSQSETDDRCFNLRTMLLPKKWGLENIKHARY